MSSLLTQIEVSKIEIDGPKNISEMANCSKSLHSGSSESYKFVSFAAAASPFGGSGKTCWSDIYPVNATSQEIPVPPAVRDKREMDNDAFPKKRHVLKIYRPFDPACEFMDAMTQESFEVNKRVRNAEHLVEIPNINEARLKNMNQDVSTWNAKAPINSASQETQSNLRVVQQEAQHSEMPDLLLGTDQMRSSVVSKLRSLFNNILSIEKVEMMDQTMQQSSFDFIKRPMSIKIISDNIDGNSIKTVIQLKKDFTLFFLNYIMIFNARGLQNDLKEVQSMYEQFLKITKHDEYVCEENQITSISQNSQETTAPPVQKTFQPAIRKKKYRMKNTMVKKKLIAWREREISPDATLVGFTE